MKDLSIFKNMNEEEISLFLKNVGARKISFKKDELVFSNLNFNDLTGIIIYGSVNVIKYDNKGNRIIINHLESNSIFGKPFIYYDKDISIVSSCESLILFIDYDLLIKNNIIINNIINIMSEEISKMDKRIELLSKKTIREKLLDYFSIITNNKKKVSFNLPITYIELADYLSIDRSAMMRELKKMKNEKIIEITDKKITIL